MRVALRVGAVTDRSRVTEGAGAITESSWIPLRVYSRTAFGAGAIKVVVRVGSVRVERNPSVGGGPGLGLIASRFATASREAGSLRLGASTTFGTSDPPRAIRMVWVR